MITDFKLFEKSILTQLGIPDAVMKVLQKSFQLKYEIPEKTKSTKSNIKNLLNKSDLILMVNDNDGEYFLIQYADSDFNYKRFTLFKYDSNGELLSTKRYPISKIFDGMIVNNYETYIVKHKHFKSYRSVGRIEDKRYLKLRDEKLNEFANYFNTNISKIMVKKYSRKWLELVQAVREYYDKITQSIDIFSARNGEINKFPSYVDTDRHKTKDFKDMAHTLHNFIEKINDKGVYKLSRNREYGQHWGNKKGFFGDGSDRDVINFLKSRKDFNLDNDGSSDDLIAKAIDQYGIMKLSTHFGRFVMTTMDDWLRNTIGEYTGLNDELDKYNM